MASPTEPTAAPESTEKLLRKLIRRLGSSTTTFSKVTTNAGDFVALPTVNAGNVTLFPHPTVPCSVRKAGAGADEFIPLVAAYGPLLLGGISNTNQLEVMRDDAGAAVDIRFFSESY